jgi:hypothetical protein
VEIVSHVGDGSKLPVDSLALEPELVISAQPAAGVLLDRVAAVVPLEGGRVAVASHGMKAVYVFDRDGRFRSSIGREGEGPGEFRAIRGAFLLGSDSLAVFDNWLGRVTVFSPRGEVARTVDVMRFMPPANGSEIHPMDADLVFVGHASVGAAAQPGVHRGSAASYRLGPDGDSLAYLGTFPGAQVFRTERLFGGLPFGAYTVSGVRGDRLIIGIASEPELREFGPSGDLRRVIRWPDHERAVTARRMQQFIDFRLESIPEEERAAAGETLRDLPHAADEPAYHGLIVSSAGVIWLGDYPGPEALPPNPVPTPRVWTLIASDGTRVRRVRTAPGFRVESVRDGLVYGVTTDALGVESVEVYADPSS